MEASGSLPNLHEMIKLLAFKVEATPQHTTPSTSGTLNTPVKIKIKIHEKKRNKNLKDAYVIVPDYGKNEIVALKGAGSNQTIMSFDMVIEKKCPKAKPMDPPRPIRYFLGTAFPGGCLDPPYGEISEEMVPASPSPEQRSCRPCKPKTVSLWKPWKRKDIIANDDKFEITQSEHAQMGSVIPIRVETKAYKEKQLVIESRTSIARHENTKVINVDSTYEYTEKYFVKSNRNSGNLRNEAIESYNNSKDAKAIMRDIIFEVEAIPRDSAVKLTSFARGTPVDIKIKIKRKGKSKRVEDTFITLPKASSSNNSTEKIPLQGINQTIMTFTMLVGKNSCPKPIAIDSPRPIRYLLGPSFPGGCLDPPYRENSEEHVQARPLPPNRTQCQPPESKKNDNRPPWKRNLNDDKKYALENSQEKIGSKLEESNKTHIPVHLDSASGSINQSHYYVPNKNSEKEADTKTLRRSLLFPVNKPDHEIKDIYIPGNNKHDSAENKVNITVPFETNNDDASSKIKSDGLNKKNSVEFDEPNMENIQAENVRQKKANMSSSIPNENNNNKNDDMFSDKRKLNKSNDDAKKHVISVFTRKSADIDNVDKPAINMMLLPNDKIKGTHSISSSLKPSPKSSQVALLNSKMRLLDTDKMEKIKSKPLPLKNNTSSDQKEVTLLSPSMLESDILQTSVHRLSTTSDKSNVKKSYFGETNRDEMDIQKVSDQTEIPEILQLNFPNKKEMVSTGDFLSAEEGNITRCIDTLQPLSKEYDDVITNNAKKIQTITKTFRKTSDLTISKESEISKFQVKEDNYIAEYNKTGTNKSDNVFEINLTNVKSRENDKSQLTTETGYFGLSEITANQCQTIDNPNELTDVKTDEISSKRGSLMWKRLSSFSYRKSIKSNDEISKMSSQSSRNRFGSTKQSTELLEIPGLSEFQSTFFIENTDKPIVQFSERESLKSYEIRKKSSIASESQKYIPDQSTKNISEFPEILLELQKSDIVSMTFENDTETIETSNVEFIQRKSSSIINSSGIARKTYSHASTILRRISSVRSKKSLEINTSGLTELVKGEILKSDIDNGFEDDYILTRDKLPLKSSTKPSLDKFLASLNGSKSVSATTSISIPATPTAQQINKPDILLYEVGEIKSLQSINIDFFKFKGRQSQEQIRVEEKKCLTITTSQTVLQPDALINLETKDTLHLDLAFKTSKPKTNKSWTLTSINVENAHLKDNDSDIITRINTDNAVQDYPYIIPVNSQSDAVLIIKSKKNAYELEEFKSKKVNILDSNTRKQSLLDHNSTNYGISQVLAHNGEALANCQKVKKIMNDVRFIKSEPLNDREKTSKQKSRSQNQILCFSLDEEANEDVTMELKATNRTVSKILLPGGSPLEVKYSGKSVALELDTCGNISPAEVSCTQDTQDTLLSVYEQEILPLQKVIREIKEQIDLLTTQQLDLKNKVQSNKKVNRDYMGSCGPCRKRL